jgi:solute carrier family 25 protein 34/35
MFIGLLYKSVFDCARKIHHEEGLIGFYKGWTANYFRLGPHTLLLLVFWDRLKSSYRIYEEKNKILN